MFDMKRMEELDYRLRQILHEERQLERELHPPPPIIRRARVPVPVVRGKMLKRSSRTTRSIS